VRAIQLRNLHRKPEIALADLPRPSIARPDEALVRVLCVGLDGTDREIMTEQYGVPPEGETAMTIGHESLGVVEEAGADSGLSPGDLVTALVRRPCRDPHCVNCRNGRSDFCQTGTYTERGIQAAHGYMAEYYVEESRYLVKVPADCLDFGVLAEPQSVVEKVWEQVTRIQQRLIWEPVTAVVLGSGPLGLLAAATCRILGLDTYVWSKGGADTPQARWIAEIGGHYREANARREGAPADLKDFVRKNGIRPDLMMDCTGFSPLAFEAMEVLAPNGILALLGVTPGQRKAEIPSDWLNLQMVLQNKCIIGSVNASRKHFETGIYRLRRIENQYPGLLKRMLTDRYRMEEVPQLDFARISVKAVVDVVPREQWPSLVRFGGEEVRYSFSV